LTQDQLNLSQHANPVLLFFVRPLDGGAKGSQGAYLESFWRAHVEEREGAKHSRSI